MKVKALALAVAAAATLPHSAFAISPTTPGITTIYLAGATASDRATAQWIWNGVCASGKATLNFTFGANPPNQWGIACTVDATSAATDLPPGDYLFLKHGIGGSGSGTVSVRDSLPVTFIQPTSCTGADPTYNCTSSTGLSHAADMGISDLNPGAFNGPNTPEGFSAFLPRGPLSNTDPNFRAFPVMGVIFGIPVTTGLRNALQNLQVVKGYLTADCDDSAANRDLTRCRPSLQRDVLKALFTGQVTDWSRLMIEGTSLTASGATNRKGAALTNTLVKICRRVNGSGTQASLGMFLETGSQFWGSPDVAPPFRTGNNLDVFENSGSSDLRNCLGNWENGTTSSLTSKLGVSTAHNTLLQKEWAIGVLSLDSSEPAADNDNWRFIKIDGVWPSGWNVFSNKYPFWGTTTFNCRPDNAWYNTFCKSAAGYVGVGTTIGAINTAISSTQPPYVALSSVPNGALTALPNSCTNTFDPANPVIGWTHGQGTSIANRTVDARRMPIPAWDALNTTCTSKVPAAGDGNGTTTTMTYPDPR